MTFTLNIGTDRNGKPSNAFKTEQEVFSWAYGNGLEVVSQRWAQSEPIGEWPAELILVVKLSGMIPLGVNLAGLRVIYCFECQLCFVEVFRIERESFVIFRKIVRPHQLP